MEREYSITIVSHSRRGVTVKVLHHELVYRAAVFKEHFPVPNE